MKNKRVGVIGICALFGGMGAILLALVWGGAAPQREGVWAAERSAPFGQLAQSGTYTAYLSLTTRGYDAGYLSPFGIRMSASVEDLYGLAAMVDAGSKQVTTNLIWSSVEPVSGVYHWDAFDAKISNATQAGMRPFVMFASNPAWAASTDAGPVTDLQALVRIAGLMAERYDCDGTDDAPGGLCVDDWSFYAEPDRNSRWGREAGAFAEMLAQASAAIHQANPRARVLIGGLAYDSFEEDGGPFVRSFLADVLTALNGRPGGALAYIDAVAFHYYPISVDRWPTIRQKALEIQGIMDQHGVGALPLLCPEAAYWSSPNFGSSELTQARRVVKMYVRSLSVGVEFLSWYKAYDIAQAGSPEDLWPDRTAGLLDVNRNPKQAYHAYAAMVDEMYGAYYREDLSRAGVEGYVFDTYRGVEQTVLWATGGGVDVPFAASCLRRTDLLGSVQIVRDGDLTNDLDGRTNGQISIRIRTDDPTYVRPCD